MATKRKTPSPKTQTTTECLSAMLQGAYKLGFYTAHGTDRDEPDPKEMQKDLITMAKTIARKYHPQPEPLPGAFDDELRLP